MKNILIVILILSFMSCHKEKCPPCVNCDVTFTYQVIKTNSDSLSVSYTEVDSVYYIGCALNGGSHYGHSWLVAPGTYNLTAKGYYAASVSISGASISKGWELRILSPSGTLLKTSANHPYRRTIYSYSPDSLYTNYTETQYRF